MSTKKVKAVSRLHYFTVVGDGPFPIDMLRHGRCWPAEGKESAQIESGPATRAVMLCGLDAPDWGRWHSMGWREFHLQPFQSYRKKKP